ncbi:hypothetical protein D1007_10938 [Hordeum vulgare]|nr:hypothetical protein D1007_10938 [Hordeum vulgare]
MTATKVLPEPRPGPDIAPTTPSMDPSSRPRRRPPREPLCTLAAPALVHHIGAARPRQIWVALTPPLRAPNRRPSAPRDRASVCRLAGQPHRPEQVQPSVLPPRPPARASHHRTRGGKGGPTAVESRRLCPVTAAGDGEGRTGRWVGCWRRRLGRSRAASGDDARARRSVYLLHRTSDYCWTDLLAMLESQVQAIFDSSIFDSSVRIQLGNGHRALFWTDSWLNGRAIKHSAPAVFTSVDSRAQRTFSVHEALTNRTWIRDITGVLIVHVHSRFLALLDNLQEVAVQLGVPDCFIWKWTDLGSYAHIIYHLFFAGLERFPCGKVISRTRAPAKCKMHVWLAMQRRIWTIDRRLRHDMGSHVVCPLFDQDDEITGHLAVWCVLARKVWHSILSHCGPANFISIQESILIDRCPSSCELVPPQAMKGFDSIVMLDALEGEE